MFFVILGKSTNDFEFCKFLPEIKSIISLKSLYLCGKIIGNENFIYRVDYVAGAICVGTGILSE